MQGKRRLARCLHAHHRREETDNLHRPGAGVYEATQGARGGTAEAEFRRARRSACKYGQPAESQTIKGFRLYSLPEAWRGGICHRAQQSQTAVPRLRTERLPRIPQLRYYRPVSAALPPLHRLHATRGRGVSVAATDDRVLARHEGRHAGIPAQCATR